MSAKNNVKLWGRNIKGVFLWGYLVYSKEPEDSSSRDLIPILWLFHTAALPFTLIFVAGIKTLIDIFTRKELSKDKKNELLKKIEDASIENMENPISDILKYKYAAQSNSSRKILEKLSNSENTTRQKIQDEIRKETKTIQSERKKVDLEEAQQITPQKIADFLTPITKNQNITLKLTVLDKLTPEDEEKLKKNNKEIFTKHNSVKIAQQKQWLKDYLSEEKNAGKELQHQIAKAFSV